MNVHFCDPHENFMVKVMTALWHFMVIFELRENNIHSIGIHKHNAKMKSFLSFVTIFCGPKPKFRIQSGCPFMLPNPRPNNYRAKISFRALAWRYYLNELLPKVCFSDEKGSENDFAYLLCHKCLLWSGIWLALIELKNK